MYSRTLVSAITAEMNVSHRNKFIISVGLLFNILLKSNQYFRSIYTSNDKIQQQCHSTVLYSVNDTNWQQMLECHCCRLLGYCTQILEAGRLHSTRNVENRLTSISRKTASDCNIQQPLAAPGSQDRQIICIDNMSARQVSLVSGYSVYAMEDLSRFSKISK